MDWADYRKGAKKAKTHIGFNFNRDIPRKIFLTNGKGGGRPFVDRILQPGETAVIDRGYQSHHDFDILQAAGKHFVIRIKENTIKTCLESFPVGLPAVSSSTTPRCCLARRERIRPVPPLRHVGYTIAGKFYWVATDRFDLLAEQITQIYILRWDLGPSWLGGSGT